MISEASQAGSRERANFQQEIMRTLKLCCCIGTGIIPIVQDILFSPDIQMSDHFLKIPLLCPL